MSREARLPMIGFALTIILAVPVAMGAAVPQPMAESGAGCTDKTKGARLADLRKLMADMESADPEAPAKSQYQDYLKESVDIWTQGLQDQSCRGFGPANEVTVEQRADGLACVRTSEDKLCFWVSEKMAPAQ